MTKASENNLWQATLGSAVNAPMLEQTANADLVIVGGGYTGCSAALRAATLGLEVRLLEARTIGFGGSGRNVGLVNAGLWLPPATIESQLGANAASRLNSVLARGPDQVFSLIEQYAIECEATRAGTLHCAHSPRGLLDLEERHRQLTAIGAPVELLGAGETAARTGSQVFHGALFDPRAGTIQPLAYCHGLARAARDAGAQMHENTPVLSISREGASWSVETPNGRVNADSLLLATNAYHAGIDGLPEPNAVPVYYFQLATEPLASKPGKAILPGGEGCWDTALIMSSFRRDAAGRLIIGGIGSLDHAGRDIHCNWASRKMRALFPQLAGQALVHAWCGRIAMTSDHIPKIQLLGENALSVFGYSGRGIAPGTLFGRAAADALATGSFDDLPLKPVDDHRESLCRARQGFYETGATGYHLLKT